MKWEEIWIKLFNTTEFMGLNMGFWVSMIVVLIIVILMNVIFWNTSPYEENK